MNIEGCKRYTFIKDSPHNRPVNLAMFLKRFPWSVYERETRESLDRAIKRLEAASTQDKPKYVNGINVISSNVDTYENLLFRMTFVM